MRLKALFIIEATHKAEAVKRLLHSMDLDRVEVLATGGHVCSNPPTLRPCHIDKSYQETHYSIKPEKRHLVELIGATARESEHVFLACDDDAEGDVIARDVFSILDRTIQERVSRCRLKAVTRDELSREIELATPFEPALAHKGDARRILDRLIGALSDHDGGVGRVQSSLLLALKASKPVTQIITHIAREPDGHVWQAKEAIRAGEVPLTQQTIALPERVPDTLILTQSGLMAEHAYNFSELVLTASLISRNDIASVANALQHEYEEGNMTYPRAVSHRVSDRGLARARFVAQKRGVNVSDDDVSQAVIRSEATGHEAPNSMSIDTPINRDHELLPVGTVLQCLATQRIVDCMTPATMYQLQAGEPLQQIGFPNEVAHLDWYRVNAPCAGSWHECEPGSRVRFTQEQSLLLFMMEHDLGRPSTMIPHITRFLSRDLVAKDFSLTAKGEQWLSKAEQIFSEVLAFNAALSTNKLPAQIVDDFLDGLDQAYLREHTPAQMVRTMLTELALIDKVDNILSFDETGMMNEYEVN